MRLRQISRALQGYDRELFVAPSVKGVPCVFRKTRAAESYDFDGTVVHRIVIRPHLVFALTDNWTVFGRPVDWGIEPILARLKEMDLHNRDVAGELIDSYEKAEKSKERGLRNDAEAFFADHRREFARATDGINTSLIKSDLNRRKSHGNH